MTSFSEPPSGLLEQGIVGDHAGAPESSQAEGMRRDEHVLCRGARRKRSARLPGYWGCLEPPPSRSRSRAHAGPCCARPPPSRRRRPGLRDFSPSARSSPRRCRPRRARRGTSTVAADHDRPREGRRRGFARSGRIGLVRGQAEPVGYARQQCLQCAQRFRPPLVGGGGHMCSFIGPPIVFHAEWPPFMYFASNPASRSAMAVFHPT